MHGLAQALYLLAEVDEADNGLVKVITHSSTSPARNTGPRPSLANTSIMAWTVLLHTCQKKPTVGMLSQNRGFKESLKIIVFQLPCHGQGQLPPDEIAQGSIQPGTEHSQG